MRILLDENLPKALGSHLSGHTVKTVQQAGWSGLANGLLLGRAQDQFDVFITADRNLQYQNVIAKFRIALIVLKLRSTRVSDVVAKVPAILSALPVAIPGAALEID